MSRGLLDTSVFVAIEADRPINTESLPEANAVSPVTLAELRVGIHTAGDALTRARRLETFLRASKFAQLPVDDSVAEAWALLRIYAGETGRRVHINDLWIAATAMANRIPVYTQDSDFGLLDGIGDLSVIKV